MPAVVLPPRFGYGPNAVKIVLLPPQKDGHRILIAIPTQPRRGRVRLTLAQYDRFLRNAVGFYSRHPAKKNWVRICNQEGPEHGLLELTDGEFSHLCMNATPAEGAA